MVLSDGIFWMMEKFYFVQPKMVGTSHTWLLSTRNMASVTEELIVKFSLIVINLNSQM